jgi:hypothetical protein
MVKEQHPSAVTEATTSVLPMWLNAFQVLLAIDPQTDVTNDGNWDGLAVRTEVYRVCIFTPHVELVTDYKHCVVAQHHSYELS